ncbi:alpha/beta hydrolase family protein [Flavobacterium aciduliphilum]|uniref:Xaa-Pro dipeptidyl-peptidase-like domain-containing protein n=1 Tax=Flavobacterium aciduliphilum TaxID=1101402 RepID=A0A328YNN4_9FLAO|nr:alpha/beta fold hydrolase [Flavobacterium aciduliphilum]RAR75698.1 hypothetical protein CLV55_101398 [Flavobacterium aciduliphilum]
MKKITLTCLLFLVTLNSFSQDISGKWYGLLTVPGMQLPLEINITKTETGYQSTMDSPDQKAFGIPVTTTSFENAVLKFAIPAGRIEYQGTFENNKIKGVFKQVGQSFPLDLSREKVEKTVLTRPQEPKKPYPYYTEEVTFNNTQDGVTLAGTLTLPNKEGNFPVVVLITGSSPQNRDEEILGHKPFLVIADYLTRNGIGVLRYDDRGTAASTGNYNNATTYDLSHDAEAAVTYLMTRKDINKKKIGLLGHSEGGVIAPMVASRNKNVSFIVLLAGTGLRGDKLLLIQQELIAKAEGATEEQVNENKAFNQKIFETIVNTPDDEKLNKDLTNIFEEAIDKTPDVKYPEGMTKEQYIQSEIHQYTYTWMKYFIRLDPSLALEKVTCPVLALNGSKDLQVAPKENLEAIKNALAKAKNKNVTVIELPNLNHLFQECTTGAPSEYAKIEQTFSPTALTEILKWIQVQVK